MKIYAIRNSETKEIIVIGRRPYYHRKGDVTRLINGRGNWPWVKQSNPEIVEAEIGEWNKSD